MGYTKRVSLFEGQIHIVLKKCEWNKILQSDSMLYISASQYQSSHRIDIYAIIAFGLSKR